MNIALTLRVKYYYISCLCLSIFCFLCINILVNKDLPLTIASSYVVRYISYNYQIGIDTALQLEYKRDCPGSE